VLVHRNKTILVLNTPIHSPFASLPAFDYAIINYPIKDFEPERLKQLARNKLIIGSNQKRYMAERWRDSCLKYDIPAHFTQLDGAFIAP
jgi:hypothetical protein